MVGCDFNPRWFWTKENYKEIYKILPGLDKPIYHICSGVSFIGDVRVDRSYIKDDMIYKRDNRRLPCNVKGDMNRLPFKSGVAGSVICDPPYDYDFTKEALISELIRICKPGGKILFIAPWVPYSSITKVLDTQLWKVGKNRPYYKILSVSIKSNGQLEDYV